MQRKLTLILGGARSGKSSHAQSLVAVLAGPTLFVATAEAGDEEMAIRIKRHRESRPRGWQTLEIPRGVGHAIASLENPPAVVLLDCLTLLVSNLVSPLEEPIDEDLATEMVDEEVRSLLAAFNAGGGQWFIISNEVGMGLVPPYPLGRIYRDLLGRANQLITREADEVFFMVAGIPMKVK